MPSDRPAPDARTARRDDLAGPDPAGPVVAALRGVVAAIDGLAGGVDPEGRVVLASPRLHAGLGLSLDEIRGRDWSELIPPEDHAAWRRSWDAAAAEGVGFAAEFRLRRIDGPPLRCRAQAVPLRDAGGPVVAWLVVCDAGEDRATTGAGSRDAEPLYRRIVETANEGIWMLDAAQRTTFVNRVMAEMLGVEPGEMLGRSAWDFTFPEDRPRGEDQWRQRLAGEPGRSEFRLRRRDGTEVWADTSTSPVLDAEGRFVGALGMFTDITARKRAEAALRESEARFRGLMEQAPFSVQVFAPDGRTIRVNRAWEELWGVTLDQIPDYNVLADPQLVARGIAPLLRRAFEGEAVQIPAIRYDPNETIPARTRHHDPIRWVAAVAYPLKDEAGRVREVVLVHEDITARTRAQEALRESEAGLRAFFDNSPALAGVIEPTGDGDILHVYDSPTTCRFFGVAPGSTAGRRATELGAPGEVIAQWLAAYEQSAESGRPARFEYRHDGPAGACWLAATVSPIGPGPSGRLRFCYVAEDITERRRVDEALRASELRWRTMAEALPNLLWTDLPDGQCDWLSSQWGTYTGIPEEQLLGLRWLETVVHPDDRGRTLACWRDACEDRAAYDLEYRIRRHDGEYRWFKTRGVPVRDEHGRIVYWFGTCTDIEDVKRLEEALRDADRRKDEFLATLAHELRNPLAAIRNALHLLGEPDGDGRGNEADRAMAERQVAHLARLIDDLMDVARISRGKIELRKEVVDLQAVVRQAVETARPLIDDRRHRLSVALPPGPILVEGDPTRLEQILWNLLNNAAKYTEPGGRIDLTAGLDGGEVVLRLRDTGVGIAPEMLPKLFRMFVQVGEHRQHAQGGLGIGLGLVRTLLEMHGGAIDAQSEGPGTGSLFVVRLPLARGAAAPAIRTMPDAPPVAESATPRRKILVIDDNVDAANSLAKLLTRRYGQDVRVAHDGPSGLALAADFRPEVVLLDIGMPGMDGHEVARRLRDRPETARALLVALTGWGQDQDRRRSQEAGFDRHLVKPIEPGAIVELLSRPNPTASTPLRASSGE